MQKAWLCLAFGSERAYAGNIGYKDEIREFYQFDNYVPNHKQIKKGDIIVLRDRSSCLGVAVIDSLTTTPSTKTILRCPECNTTGIKTRKTKMPRFRCNKRHEFDSPIKSNVPCTQYIASFGTSFYQPHPPISADSLRNICLRPADQLSIQELDFNNLRALIALPVAKDNGTELGSPYKKQFVQPSTTERKPFEVDPDAIDRATSAHANLQNMVAEWLIANKFSPRQPKPTEPPYDIGWEHKGTIFLCEVKSLTDQNEEKQLRFGLGQLLRYIHKLTSTGANVIGLLMIERRPKDEEWIELCRKLNIFVLWPSLLSKNIPQSIGS